MKSFIVFSDIHGNREAFNKLLPLINENDGAIFAGDGVTTFRRNEISGEFYAVRGNNDYSVYPAEQIAEIEGHRIFIAHGDAYGVRSGLTRLKLRAEESNCDAVIFGHTHLPEIVEENGIIFINPGSCERFASVKTFAYVVFEKDKKVSAFINEKTLNF